MPVPSLGNLIGLLQYNGVKFDPLYTSHIQGDPVYDDANRVVKMLKWAISASAYVTVQGADSTTDPYLGKLRQKLTQPGQALYYSNKGFGNFAINDPAVGVFDVNWGPKPELLSFKPVGNNLGALVEWRCTVCIPECPTAVFQKALMMLNYSVSWDIDTDGYTVITTRGALEIPLTYRSGNKVVDNADNYRHLAVAPPPVNFQRKQNFTLSEDRRRLDFSVIDTEMPAPLPVGCTLAHVRHKVESTTVGGRSSGAQGFLQWVNTISGTFRVLPDRPKSEAFDKFFNIVAQKVNTTIGFRTEIAPRVPILVLLTHFQMENDIFGKDVNFSISYYSIGYSLRTVLRVSGIFNLITDATNAVGAPPQGDLQSFFNWQRANKQMAAHVRGNIQATFGKDADILLDLCVGAPSTPTTPTSQVQNIPSRSSGNQSTPDLLSPIRRDLGVQGSSGTSGPEETSWLMYECAVQYFEDDHVIRHKPLAGMLKMPSDGDDYSKLSSGEAAGRSGAEKFGPRTNVPDRFQRLCAPSGVLKLSGEAVRVGHQIAAPRVLAVSGNKVIQAGQVIVPKQIGAIQGIPVWSLTWDITYYLSVVPAQALPTIANPVFGIDGQTGLASTKDTELQIPIAG